MNIVSHTKIYLGISITLILASLLVLVVWGLELGIDFTGGSIIEIEFSETRPSSNEVKEKLKNLELGKVSLKSADSKSLILRLKNIDEETHQKILEKFGQGVEEKKFESIGPVIGTELKKKTLYAITLALLAIVLYVAWAFRNVSKPIASWQYGLVAIAALFHDIVITLGVFALLGEIYKVEISLVLVAAFLTILGYSVNNSIVVFDRVRENLIRTDWSDFRKTINQSINQSLMRCLNTALTTLFVLLAIFFIGGESIRYFALALVIGIVVGTYSSIFTTTSLLTLWYERKYRR